jgi:glycerophosphoryl diester phosphodiesterase
MPLHIQGHRGAQALAPENTLTSFEAALDARVDSIETDVHRTADGVLVLWHDPWLDPARRMWIAQHSWDELREAPLPVAEQAWHNVTAPAAEEFAACHDRSPRCLVTVAELFAFVDAYAASAEKTEALRDSARRVVLDLELKRVPFAPELTGDDRAEPIEQAVLAEIRRTGMLERCVVRSFDHRAVRAVHEMEPKLTTGAVVAFTAPVSPESICRDAGASWYCPEYRFVDREAIARCHAAGLRVLAWTVNEPAAWERLVAWGIDGITTDDPRALRAWWDERCR